MTQFLSSNLAENWHPICCQGLRAPGLRFEFSRAAASCGSATNHQTSTTESASICPRSTAENDFCWQKEKIAPSSSLTFRSEDAKVGAWNAHQMRTNNFVFHFYSSSVLLIRKWWKTKICKNFFWRFLCVKLLELASFSPSLSLKIVFPQYRPIGMSNSIKFSELNASVF